MSTDDPAPQSESAIAAAWAPDTFEQLSQIWQQKLTEHLAFVCAGNGPVLNQINPQDAVRRAEALLRDTTPKTAAARAEKFRMLLDVMLASGQNLHHPRYVGHQVPANVPSAALFDAVGSVTNQPMAIWEMGPWATAVEHALIRAMCGKVGWNPDHSSGLLTSGGSLANLTALLTARNVAFPDSWEHGPPSDAVLFAHADAHYCVSRAAGILGIGTAQIKKAALDARRRIDPEQLDSAISQEKKAGRRVMAVAAAACATPIGAFDPLADIAEVCRKHGLWLHADAAHGGGTLMSRKHRCLLSGIDQVDSLVWDAHKMLFVPALCAAVLYRDRTHRFETFQQDAPYLFDPADPRMAEFDSGMRTVECTKRSLGFSLWGLWSVFGESVFEQMVDHTFDLAQYLFQLLEAAPDFEPLHTPECNIVVFRHVPDTIVSLPADVQNRFQQQVRAAVVRSGDFYIVQTTIDGIAALRVTVMNPQTSRSDMDALLEAVRTAAARVDVHG